MTQTAGAARRSLDRARALLPRRQDLEAVRQAPARDLVAGITVGVVALPLALAFGIASGMGAAAGLVTAVVAGVLAAVFGGSNLQVSGPTGAMTVVLVPIVGEHGAAGVLVVGMAAGAMLVVMAFAGVGRYIKLVPLPVVEGFTVGIAVIIALQQVPVALGVESSGEQVLLAAGRAAAEWVASPQWTAPAVTTAVTVVVLGLGRLRPSLPGALLAVAAATVAALVAELPLGTIGALPSRLPSPRLPDLSAVELQPLLVPAVAVAALVALESLLSATVADAMSVAQRHDPDRELFGQGVANLVTPLFGGVPATAAIARTAVNVRAGARSRLASVTHAGVLLLIMLLLAPVVAHVPLAALAGVLIATAARMVEVSSLRALWRSTRSDAAVLMVTLAATVLLDLATAVVLGVVVAGGLALRQLARTAALHEVPQDHPVGAEPHDDEEHALLHDHIVAFRLEGPMFFLAVHNALLELSEISDIRAVVLRMSHVTALDATGAAVLADTIAGLESRGIEVMVSGVPDRLRRVLGANGLLDRLTDRQHLFGSTVDAIAHARAHVVHEPAPRVG